MSTTVSAVPMEMELTRFFRAPRELVWRAWTDVEQLKEWWGPKQFTNPRCEADVQPGGLIHIDMRAPDGTVYPMGGEFEEVVPPEKLVFLAWALDADGDPIFTNRNTVLFKEVEDGTEIRLHVRVVEAKAAAWQYLKGMREGWSGSFEKLAEFIGTR
ncbi:SRPBCC domain-containing protein [Granulicella sp. 5B5]|uniref:SRPBCC family protein n=1 Tax=Granulicella sp. 5B5 TaxID=1617967 RepID=UPI0015F42AEF|nr:SRPBCC domain-containing protein [Granulicella sp. 5B5]QMV18461.1 SRPBCC domain-containing protein [Granulicella sp. 5B5]